MIKSIQTWIVLLLATFSVASSFGISATKEPKNVLLINSYYQGYVWTDSVTSGIINTLKLHPEITLYIENLYSKKFGQSNFEAEKDHIRSKYAGISFDGILITDNDALDFAFLYDDYLFPNRPVVFAGISNPEDYPLNGSTYYGFQETVNTGIVLNFVKKILPEAKKLLVLTDLTTTGKIYRKELTSQAAGFDDFSVSFPEVIDLDSIYRMVSSENAFDAIYYIGINQDKNGRLVDYVSLLDTLTQLAKVPVLNNDPLFIGKGVMGCLYQSGKKHGSAAANLIIQLMDSTADRPAKRHDITGTSYYFDKKILDKYDIPMSRIPEGSKMLNNPGFPNKKYFLGLVGILAFLVLIVILLSSSNRRTKKAELKIRKQLKLIKNQNIELEEAYQQLSGVIPELEKANSQLKETNRDLTESKKKAEESDNLKSAFLANVSHEIRTPLNSIVGFSSLLSESDLSEETRNSYIELIESNTESLLVLIDEILDLSKIESQQLTIKKQDFSIDALMNELFQIFSHSYQNSKVELRMSKISDDKELFVYSDRVRVKQIYINLLSNAFKFTDTGIIEMGYFLAENQEIVLYVKDSGIGISKEHHQIIFNRFRKLNENSGRVFRGTGLGLAITQKLVELLGGKIWIESEPGEGSTFLFTLKDCVLKQVE